MPISYEDLIPQVQDFIKNHCKLNSTGLVETWEPIDRIGGLKIKDMVHLQNLCQKLVVDFETKQTTGYIVGYPRKDGKIILLDGNHRSAFYIVKGFKKIPIVLLECTE